MNKHFIAKPNSTVVPARLHSEEVAEILGFNPHDVPVLIAKRLLEPLGKPVPNSTKYFAKPVILSLAEDPHWLDKATQALYDYWKRKNKAKRTSPQDRNGGEPISLAE